MKKSNLLPRNAFQELLMVYRRTPLANGSSPSELLNGRQIRAHIDLLLPSPVHLQQSKQSMDSSKVVNFSVGDLVFARYFSSNNYYNSKWIRLLLLKYAVLDLS